MNLITRTWLHGLISAIITGLTTAFLTALGITGANAAGIKVDQLNLRQLGVLTLFGGLVGAAAYLRQSPLPDDPEEGPAKTGKYTPPLPLTMLALGLSASLMTGCTTTSSQIVQDALPAIPTAVSVAGTLALNLGVKDASQRQTLANEMYAVAAAVRSLSGGAAPTPDQVTAAVTSFGGKDPNLDGVVNAVGSIWKAYFPSVQGDPKLAMQILEAIAEGAEQAAKNVTDIKAEAD